MSDKTQQNSYPGANSIELESRGLTWTLISLIGIFMIALVASYQPDQPQLVQQPDAGPLAPGGFESGIPQPSREG